MAAVKASTNELKREDFKSQKEFINAVETERLKQRVQIHVPRDPGGDPELVVQHNGRTYQIKRGQMVTVPMIVAEILMQSQHQQDVAYQMTVDAAAGLK